MSFFKGKLFKIAAGLFVLIVGCILWIGPHHLKVWFNHARAEIASTNVGKTSPYVPVESKIAQADGMIQVYVPAGEFLMGSDDKDDRKSNPSHAIYLGAYWIDQTEVSRGMYNVCVNAHGCAPIRKQRDPYIDDPAYSNYPVVYIKWEYAQAYCIWAGRRLPTEAEWEKAARGTDGRIFPWGDTPPTISLANFNNNIGELTPVDHYLLGASPYGALNMAGNVREWTLDWYAPFYYRHSPAINPSGPETGDTKSLRGGSFLDDERQLRTFNRFDHEPNSPGGNRGFRCAESVP
jgi:formylglycine-generating enzyme required for sulfatase activity